MTAQLIEAVEASRATAEFTGEVRKFSNEKQPTRYVQFNRGCPPVKVERVLTQLLKAHPDLTIRSVTIDGESGCEFFRGTVAAETHGGTRRWAFHWDCRWRAKKEGWTDGFGFPDQIRAARVFGHDCFRTWEELPAVAPSA